MNDLIARLIDSLRETSAGTKLVAALSGVGLLVIVGFAAVVSNRSEPRPTFFGLDDHDLAAVNKALAAQGITFEVSSSSAPYTVSVDDSDRSAAFAAAYGSGAFDKPLRGVLTEGAPGGLRLAAPDHVEGDAELLKTAAQLLPESGVLSGKGGVGGDPQAPISASGKNRRGRFRGHLVVASLAGVGEQGAEQPRREEPLGREAASPQGLLDAATDMEGLDQRPA